MVILGNNKKLIKTIEISEIAILADSNSYSKIIEINGDILWLLAEGILTGYNYKKDIILKTYDLTKWQPHQLEIDGNTVWLISKKDGQLYGFKTN